MLKPMLICVDNILWQRFIRNISASACSSAIHAYNVLEIVASKMVFQHKVKSYCITIW